MVVVFVRVYWYVCGGDVLMERNADVSLSMYMSTQFLEIVQVGGRRLDKVIGGRTRPTVWCMTPLVVMDCMTRASCLFECEALCM